MQTTLYCSQSNETENETKKDISNQNNETGNETKKDISNQNNETKNETKNTKNDTKTEKDTKNETGNEITNQNNETENETDATNDDAHRQLVISCEMDAKYGPHSGTYGLHLCKPGSFAHQHPDTSLLLIAVELSHMQWTLPILPSRVFTSARMESV